MKGVYGKEKKERKGVQVSLFDCRGAVLRNQP